MLGLEEGMARLVELAGGTEPRAGQTRIIAVDGRSGAGKTDMAQALAARLAVPAGELDAVPLGVLDTVPVVELEFLYGGWQGLNDGIERLVADVLVPLARGRAALVPRYDWLAEAWGEALALEPPDLLIVEGVGAGARAIRPYLSLLAWLELSEELRHARAMARDGDVYAGHWEEWKLHEDAYLASDRPREHADLLVSGEG